MKAIITEKAKQREIRNAAIIKEFDKLNIPGSHKSAINLILSEKHGITMSAIDKIVREAKK